MKSLFKRMKYIIVLLLISINVSAQSKYELIDEKSKSAPDSLHGASEIADYLTRELDDDQDKVRALYIWITHNIKYDLNQLRLRREYNNTDEIVRNVLIEREGICMHYAYLFFEMSKSVGLDSYLVSGYTKDVKGKIATSGHVWNAVELDGSYYLLDATWAAGYQFRNKYVHEFRDDYFLIPPNDFIKTHMPFDPIWQFENNPINNEEFKLNDYSKLEKDGTFNFRDSIISYEKKSELEQLKELNRRLIASGINNKPLREEMEQNYYNIGVLEYKLAVDSYSFGVQNYNTYVEYRNKRFRNPKVPDSLIRSLIDNAERGMKRANKLFIKLADEKNKQKKKGIDSQLEEMLVRIPISLSNLEREIKYVNKYLKTWRPFRGFVLP